MRISSGVNSKYPHLKQYVPLSEEKIDRPHLIEPYFPGTRLVNLPSRKTFQKGMMASYYTGQGIAGFLPVAEPLGKGMMLVSSTSRTLDAAMNTEEDGLIPVFVRSSQAVLDGVEFISLFSPQLRAALPYLPVVNLGMKVIGGYYDLGTTIHKDKVD